jgi:hypothetical protein
MAVALDVITTGVVQTLANTGTSATTGTVTVAAGATMALAFCEESINAGSDANITGEGTSKPDFGAVAMTLLSGSKKHSGTDAGTSGFGQMFTLANPPTGASKSGNWAMTFSSGGANGLTILQVATFTGALDASPLGAAKVINGDFVASLTLTETLATGDLFVAFCLNGGTLPTVTTGTSIGSTTGTGNSGSHAGMRVATNTGTGSVSIIFGTDNTDHSVAVGVKIIAATAGGPPPPFPRFQTTQLGM